jgi:hypothetical protein
VPPLFATKGVSLQTSLLEPTQLKLSVGGVDVGGILPWLQMLLITQRTLELTYYETPTQVIVTGSLRSLRLSEPLRVEIKRDEAKPANLDRVVWAVGTEIERLRLSGDQSNRVEALNTDEFGELISALNDTVRFNSQTARGRPALEQFATLLARLEPLALRVTDWYQLHILVANVAESARKFDRAVAHLESAIKAMQKELNRPGAKAQPELRKQIAASEAKLKELRAKAPTAALVAEEKTIEQIKLDARHATEAFNKLFNVVLEPLPVKLLPVHEPNAYSDGKTFFAPPAIAQLPEITWHNMSWQYINKHLPVFGTIEGEGLSVAHAYSDILPMLIRQLKLVEFADPSSWNLYSGGVAWIRAAIERRDFKLGDDRRPLRSFANPGTAYTDPVVGKDSQIAHYRDLTAGTEAHAGAGIGTKAFYETAQRLGVPRAGEVWLAALACLPGKGPVTYKGLAACLLESGGADRSKVDEALRVVGLGSSPSSN